MREKNLKGITPVISTIMLIGILSVITFSAYQWGLPLIDKSMSNSILLNAESFLGIVDQEIYQIAKSGGSKEILFDLPGDIRVYPNENKIEFSLATEGSIYMQGGAICLSLSCDKTPGIFGEDSYSVLEVESQQLGDQNTVTAYTLTYRNLTSSSRTYELDIVTPGNAILTGSKNSRLIITKSGEIKSGVVRTIIEIGIR